MHLGNLGSRENPKGENRDYNIDGDGDNVTHKRCLCHYFLVFCLARDHDCAFDANKEENCYKKRARDLLKKTYWLACCCGGRLCKMGRELIGAKSAGKKDNKDHDGDELYERTYGVCYSCVRCSGKVYEENGPDNARNEEKAGGICAVFKNAREEVIERRRDEDTVGDRSYAVTHPVAVGDQKAYELAKAGLSVGVEAVCEGRFDARKDSEHDNEHQNAEASGCPAYKKCRWTCCLSSTLWQIEDSSPNHCRDDQKDQA